MDPIITHIDTACCLIEIGGIKILTDPALDKAGKLYHHGYGAISRKTSNPKIDDASLNNVDLILLSHPQHKDNFDIKGREFARTVPLILSTKKIEKDYKNGKGLKPWEQYEVNLPDNSKLKITATPAQHHPGWLPKFFSGEVIGFLIQHSNSDETLYISGDTVYFNGINEIGEKFKNITYALVHVGSAEFRYLSGPGKFTMDAKGFIKTVEKLKPKLAIPIHNQGWSHFKENDEGIKLALTKTKESISKHVLFLKTGERSEMKHFKR